MAFCTLALVAQALGVPAEPVETFDQRVIEAARQVGAARHRLWAIAKHGDLLSSTVAATIIRTVELDGPDGESPDDA